MRRFAVKFIASIIHSVILFFAYLSWYTNYVIGKKEEKKRIKHTPDIFAWLFWRQGEKKTRNEIPVGRTPHCAACIPPIRKFDQKRESPFLYGGVDSAFNCRAGGYRIESCTVLLIDNYARNELVLKLFYTL